MNNRNNIIAEVQSFLKDRVKITRSVYERVWKAIDVHVLTEANIATMYHKVEITDKGIKVNKIQFPQMFETAMEYFVEQAEIEVGVNINWKIKRNVMTITASEWVDTEIV